MQAASQRRPGIARRAILPALFAGLLLGSWGCANQRSGPDATMRDLEPVPLPGLDGSETQRRSLRQIPRLTVQRMDVALDQPLDGAWSTIEQDSFPAITRGAWQTNGLRIGVLHDEQVTAFAQQMPEVVNFFEQQVLTRSHPVAIMQAAPLRSDTKLSVDLTLPPGPTTEMAIHGQRGGHLQLLARMEQEDDRWYLVLIPHLYRSRANGFDQRTLMDRDLDGRVFYELAIRVELKTDRLIAVGLHWPWPEEPAGPGEGQPPTEESDPEDPSERAEIVLDTTAAEELSELGSVLSSNDSPQADDPAAPPQRVRTVPRQTPKPLEGPQQGIENASGRAMPELPVHFGRVLFTGVRARRPVQTLLLISMPPVEPEVAEAQEGDQAEQDTPDSE